MLDKDPLVHNAADPKQVKNAKRKEKFDREGVLQDIRMVLSTPEGKRLIWRLLSHCRTFESIYEQSARIHYNAGQQDLGHFIMAEIISADEQLLFTMMKDNLKGEN